MIFPLGPYHPALTEPMGLRLALRGETVTNVETQLGYLHRGIEDLATTRDLPAVLDLVERTCGTCGHSHRLALSLALEQLAEVTVPPRAAALRTVFAEVERVLARLWLLMQVARVGELGGLFTSAIEAREILFEACAAATGTRLFWGIPVPGGAQGVADPQAIANGLTDCANALATIDRQLAPQGPIARRMVNVGKIPLTTVNDLGITGLVARAAGQDEDVRLATPYDAYPTVKETLVEDATKQLTGDVAHRLFEAGSEIRQSMHVITALLDDLPEGQERATFPALLGPGLATARVEGPHGREVVLAQVGIAEGKPVATDQPGWLTELRLSTPSATNSGLIPIALTGQRLGDVPLILASLDLCVACIDR
jgi:ech hydrogenase subunit E